MKQELGLEMKEKKKSKDNKLKDEKKINKRLNLLLINVTKRNPSRDSGSSNGRVV